jgi:nitrite reductase/ring-hydroxylating ferredoxin subunit
MADACASATVPLCHIEDIADPGARGFEVASPGGLLDVIVVRRDRDIRGYVNCCPHQGTPLETFPDRFLSRDGCVLICSTHGARFRIEDGLCIEGPCVGRRLRPVSLYVDGEAISLVCDPLAQAR